MNNLLNGGKTETHFLNLLTAEIGLKAAEKVVSHAREIMKHAPEVGANTTDNKLCLLYGLIQSGKTNIINMTIAVAKDNAYKLFVILTDRNKSLQNQTFERADSALKGPLVRNIADLDEHNNFIEMVLKNDGIVLICKKDPTDLEKLKNFLTDRDDLANTPTLIIDDEADAVGLDTKQRMEGESPSTINSQLREVRQLVGTHMYLQVTATPQAIILQDKESDGFHPEFIEVVEAGSGYTGIHQFFKENKKRHIRSVDLQEITKLRDLNNENLEFPEGLLNSLVTFVLGVAIKLQDKSEKPEDQKFSFMCHISQLKDIHNKIKSLVNVFIKDLYIALKDKDNIENRDKFLGLLSKAYADLQSTLPDIPEFPILLSTLNDYINSYEVFVLNTSKNSNTEIKLTKKFNFIIGGNKLGRGITIPRLLVTYYGRLTGNPQVDTLMQHARMCGYRSRDLDITRVYIPDDIADLFETICDHDAIQRDIIKNHGQDSSSTLYLDNKGINPTRPPVIPKTVGAYKAGQSISPKIPEYRKSKSEKVTKYLDEKIKSLNKEKQIISYEIDEMLDVINRLPIKVNGKWNKQVISQYLKWFKESKSNTGQLIYALDLKLGLSETRGYREIASVLNPSLQDLVNSTDTDKPVLVLVRNKVFLSDKGNQGREWDGSDFWVPLFKFPSNKINVLFNYESF
ncbi:Z1 domain-containing protein [Bacillus subtilis]